MVLKHLTQVPLLIYWEAMLSMFRLVDRFSTMPSGSEPRKNSGQSCPCFSQETTVKCLKGKVPTQVSCYLPGTFWLSIQSYTLSLGKVITKSRETQRLDLSLAKGKRAKVQRDFSRRLWEKNSQIWNLYSVTPVNSLWNTTHCEDNRSGTHTHSLPFLLSEP